jgi:hypothetical protein
MMAIIERPDLPFNVLRTMTLAALKSPSVREAAENQLKDRLRKNPPQLLD